MSRPGIGWGRLAMVPVVLAVLFGAAVASKWLIVETTSGIWVVSGLFAVAALGLIIAGWRGRSK
jgi:hypothetical protein